MLAHGSIAAALMTLEALSLLDAAWHPVPASSAMYTSQTSKAAPRAAMLPVALLPQLLGNCHGPKMHASMVQCLWHFVLLDVVRCGRG